MTVSFTLWGLCAGLHDRALRPSSQRPPEVGSQQNRIADCRGYELIVWVTGCCEVYEIMNCATAFASRALALRESLNIVGKLLGHNKCDPTSRYAHLTRHSITASSARVADSVSADILTTEARRRRVNAPTRCPKHRLVSNLITPIINDQHPLTTPSKHTRTIRWQVRAWYRCSRALARYSAPTGSTMSSKGPRCVRATPRESPIDRKAVGQLPGRDHRQLLVPRARCGQDVDLADVRQYRLIDGVHGPYMGS